MIIRTYGCNECGLEWEVTVEDSSAPDPDCPECSKVLQWIPARVNIGTYKGKAIDVTQDIMERDFGLSNFNDCNREGDVAYRPDPPMHTNERENIEQQVREYVAQTTAPVAVPTDNRMQAKAIDVEMNWGGSGGSTQRVAAQPIPVSAALAAAKQGPGAEVNPMQMLQDGIKAGHLRAPARIMARWKP